MKKAIPIILASIMLLCMFTGCSSKNSSVVGTWYSDQDDESVLLLKKDNTYTDGSWLSTGEFFVEENTVVMVGPLDGTHKLKIEQEDGQMILRYYDRDSEIPRTFYKSADQAQTARDVRKEAERIAAEEQAAAELKELEDGLIGYWYTDSRSPIEFTQDGLYIEYTADGIQQGKYQVLSGSELSVTKADGSEVNLNAQFEEDGTLQLDYDSYTKAEPLALSTDLLLGEWYASTDYEGNPSREYFDNGTYAIKSLFPEYVSDTIINYTVEDKNHFMSYSADSPDKMTGWAYLSKTETDYQLYWSHTEENFAGSYTSLVFLSRPISDN